MSIDLPALREREFPWAGAGGMIYLNSASTGPLPQRSIIAAIDMTQRRARPALIPDVEIFSTLANSRTLLARLVNCSADEIALTPNTSFGINLAANSLPLGRGDVVLTFEREFPALVYPWLSLRRRGVEVRFIPCVDGLPNEQRLLEALDDPGVRAVAVSWVSFASGYRVDLAALGRECRARGIYLVVDGIQGLGPAALDLSALQVDIFANGCQKWLLSPWGTGFVYVRHELIRELEPRYVGWLGFEGSEDFASLTNYQYRLRSDARRFEVGTIPLQDFAALNASLELILSLGPAAIEAHVASLTLLLTEWARAREGVTLLSPEARARRAGIVSLGFENAQRVADALQRANVACSLREGAIRLAPNFFNSAAEVSASIQVMESAIAQ